MVTASHNPPADNGYKVYLGDGAQIVPPADVEISAAIDAVGPLSSVPLATLDDPRVERVGAEMIEAFQTAEVGLSLVPSAREVSVVYTAMHGVGRDQVVGVWRRAGFPPLHLVAAQADPDPDFPTVAFPNPEEPGALDLALADAARVHPDVLIANDPDADRLGAAIPDGAGGYRPLRGDEIGMLLADHVLRHTSGSDRLVATTVVSSTMLSKMAAAAGVQYAETLTGFKWIARAALDRPGTRLRVRVRGSARLPRGRRGARQGRHQRGDGPRRDRCAREGRGRVVAGPARFARPGPRAARNRPVVGTARRRRRPGPASRR